MNLDEFRRRADRLVAQCEGRDGPHSRMARVAVHAAERLFEDNNPEFMRALSRMKRLPVTIQEFVDGNDFLGGVEYDIWPALKEDVYAMNPDVLLGEPPVHEAMLGGATGTGKTHTSMATMAYQGYMLTCFTQPQKLFGLTPSTPIVFMLQSISPTITKRVIYQPFRTIMTEMRYFQKYVPYNRHLESELQFEGNIKFVPALASLSSLLGQAICAALLDEVNFMAVIEHSTKAAGPAGMGGKFDQAAEVYTNISRRRKRSFTTRGMSVGCICTVSSTRYKDDFLDRRIDQAIRFEEPNVKFFRHKQYEVNPKYAGDDYDTFQIAVGNAEQGTVVIEDHMVAGVHYPVGAEILDVPMPYKPDFQKDPDAALRDIVGIATDAITPFIRKRQKINDALLRGKDRDLKPLVEKDEVLLAEDGMPVFIPENMPKTPQQKAKSRWVHVDLSRVEDRCGIAMVCLDGFVASPIREEGGEVTVLPRFTVEMAVGIKPSPQAEIDIAEVRRWVMLLATEYGLNIEGISFDGFDSRETIQALMRSGIYAEYISVDIGTTGYDGVRDALYEDRMDIQGDCELLSTELRTIEYYPEKRKVDHPPRGSKDVSDGVAGAVQAALKSRVVRRGIEMRAVNSDDETTQRLRVEHNRVTPKVDRRRKRTRRKSM